MSSLAPERAGRRSFLLVAGALVLGTVVPAALLLQDGGDAAAPERGDAAPRFDALPAVGERPVVLHFCGSWNPLCEEDAEWLAEVRDRVAVVDVLVEDDPDRAASRYEEWGVTWPLVEDGGGEIAAAYGVEGVPQTFFVYRDGRVAARNFGALAPTTLAGRVDDLLRG